MANTSDELKARVEFYETILQNYKKLLDLLEGKMTSKLEETTFSINENFTDKIYVDANRILTEYEILEQVWKDKRIDYKEYISTAGDLKRQMSQLDVHYKMNVDTWMDELKKGVDSSAKKKLISKEIAEKAIESIEQLNINKYYTKSHAVIIGINDYQNESNLGNAVNDAKAVRDTLVKDLKFDNPIQLYDDDADEDNIRHVFEDQLQDPKIFGNNDRVLVYYSGHGKIRETGEGKDGKPITKGYLIPMDAKKEAWSSCIKMDDVVQACRDCPSKHVLLVLDCCYSGVAARGTSLKEKIGNKTLQQYVDVLTKKSTLQYIAAGQDDEEVNDSSIIKGHSPFTAAFLEVLGKETDSDNDGLLTGNEVGSLVRSTVLSYNESGGSSFQTPVFGSLPGGIGEFVFKIFQTVKKKRHS